MSPVRSLSTLAEPSPGIGGRRFQSVLPMNHCIHVGDYIVSANGMFFAVLCSNGTFAVCRGSDVEHSYGSLWESAKPGLGNRFFALLQSDGNFCIYRGDSLQRNEGWQWGTQMTAEGGQFYALLRNDGVFAVCQGSGPGAHLGDVWSSGVADPVRSIDTIVRIDYEMQAARVMQSMPCELYSETVRNDSDTPSSSLVTGSVNVTDNFGWSDTLGPGVTAPPGFQTHVPILTEGKIVHAPAPAQVYSRNSASMSSRSWGFNAPAAVPARSAMQCQVSARRTTISVPYALAGLFTLASGVQLPGTIHGMYSGSNCHDLAVTLSTNALAEGDGYVVTRPLAPMPSANAAAY